MTHTPGNDTASSPNVIVAEWLNGLERALASGDSAALAELFADGATWRDFMAFSWDVSHRIGVAAVTGRLATLASSANPASFRVIEDPAPDEQHGAVRGFFEFRTTDRVDRGYVVLAPVGSGYVATTLATLAERLEDFPERTGARRQTGRIHGLVMNRTRWSDDRRKASAFTDAEPAVVIVGAGHNGLVIAARLEALGVASLVVDKQDRIGDTWRNRYSSLALHSLLDGDHLPYLPFPSTWTANTPRNKWADFLESYATLLDLNVWTGTEFEGGDYDEQTHTWSVRLRGADGAERIVRPHHLVIATGLMGTPRIPEIPGLDTFEGEYAHSAHYQGTDRWSGKKALVVGAGVSAHEMAQDLHEHGAEVTLLQRSETYVVNIKTVNKIWLGGVYGAEAPFPLEYADIIANATPIPVALQGSKYLIEQARAEDKELLDKLEARGFRLGWGYEGTGFLGSHLAGRDGYQLNVGASELIAEGAVSVKSGVELVEVRPRSVLFSDGTELETDVILFSTGYEPLWNGIAPRLGTAGERIGGFYGVGTDGELRNNWRPTAQPGLWFGTGQIVSSRFNSKFLALTIKAIEEGLVSPDLVSEAAADRAQLLSRT